ncbi:lipase secretion chaperone [Marinobacter sp.]|uniref:lipase secretion chaperone n=1 Tax=Marinobacter sp. TaxID=50741 RepID=UPI0034A2D229
MKVSLWLATGLLVIIAVIAGLWLTAGAPERTAPEIVADQQPPEPATTSGDERPSRLVGQPADDGVPETLPASLAGTAVPPGWAKVDSNGNLIPTPQLRQLFEYYLSALGEEPLPVLVARIEQQLAQLQEPARSEALEILGHYLDYKLALGELEGTYGDAAELDPGEVERRMAEIRALRRTWLDADTADAFFAGEEAIDQFQLRQRQIANDQTLSADERAEALARAEQALPEPVRRARQETRRFAEYEQARQNLASDPDALKAWREEAFDAETVEKLEVVEARQRHWDSRWQAYREERNALNKAGLAAPEREAAVKDLRERHFDGPERLRAEALDSLR